MKDIGLWIAAVILTKAVYYDAVRTIHKDYSKAKIIKIAAAIIGVSLIADVAAFLVKNYRMYLVIDISVQFVIVYIWSMIRIRVFSRIETVLRIIAMMFPILLTGFVQYYRDNNNVMLEGLFITAGALVSLLMYNYAFGLMPKVQQDNELEAKRHQVEILQEHEQQLSDNYKEYQEFLLNYHKHLSQIGDSGNRIAAMNTVLDAITDDLKNLKTKKYCANTIVNVILNQTARRCNEAGITFSANVNLPMEIGINDIHLCSIFNNLMNNAVKANEYVLQDRFITINCSLTGNYMRVNVDNSFNPGHKREKRRGYGMIILKDIASAYDGQYSVKRKKNVFSSTFIAKVNTDFDVKEDII